MTTDKNKTIWLFNQYAITPEQAGGSRHFSIARLLVEKGYDITIFAAGFNYQERKETKCTGRELFKIEMIDGVRFVWIKTAAYTKNNWKRIVNMLSYSYRVCHLYKKLTESNKLPKPGIVIGSAVHLFAVFSGYRIARHFRVPFIMEVRDLWPMTIVEFKKSYRFHPGVMFFGWLDRFLARRADHLVSVLPYAYDFYKRYGLTEQQVTWIPNGVDTSAYPQMAQLPSTATPEKPFTVRYTGTFGNEACLHTLLGAAKIIQDKNIRVQFEITGSGEKKSELLELCKTLSLSNMTFHPPVIKDAIPGLLTSADALWIGSKNVKNLYKYGFSFNKLFEYLASGKPVLFSIDSRYNPVEESKAGLTIPPENGEALADAIIKLVEMTPEQRMEMGNRGIEHVRKCYTFEILAGKFDELLSNVENWGEKKTGNKQREI